MYHQSSTLRLNQTPQAKRLARNANTSVVLPEMNLTSRIHYVLNQYDVNYIFTSVDVSIHSAIDPTEC